jgi:hypothetical protein
MSNATTNPANLYRAQLAQMRTDFVTNLVPSDAFMRKVAADESWIKTLITKLLQMACNLEPTASGEIFGKAIKYDYSAQRPTEMINKMELKINVSAPHTPAELAELEAAYVEKVDHTFGLLSTDVEEVRRDDQIRIGPERAKF